METSHPRKDLADILVEAENLPSIPAVALEVLRLTRDEESSVEDMAQVLSRDPALSAKLLKLSNSALFNLGQDVTTIQRAAMVLGMRTVRLMSLSFSLVQTLPRAGNEEHFDYREFWRRCIVLAVAGRSLAKLVKSGMREEAFLCGLLGHIGRMVLSRTMAEEYAGAVAASECGWPAPSAERRRLGFGSDDVGAALLRHWDLPEIICTAVEYMQRPRELPAEAPEPTAELTWLMHMAVLVEKILCEPDKGGPLSLLQEIASKHIGRDPAEMDAFLIGLESGINETAELLEIRLPEDVSHDEIVHEARQQIVNVSLGTAVENRQLTVRATFDKLTGLHNRASFDEFLKQKVRRKVSGAEPQALGLILFDIDHFKRFNDTHGHQAGDEVLAQVGRVINEGVRGDDMAARYGGEEFAVVVPKATPNSMGKQAERLRRMIAALEVDYKGAKLSVTASFGAACAAQMKSEIDGKRLIELADRLLYQAKRNGRNRCEVHPHLHLPKDE